MEAVLPRQASGWVISSYQNNQFTQESVTFNSSKWPTLQTSENHQQVASDLGFAVFRKEPPVFTSKTDGGTNEGQQRSVFRLAQTPTNEGQVYLGLVGLWPWKSHIPRTKRTLKGRIANPPSSQSFNNNSSIHACPGSASVKSCQTSLFAIIVTASLKSINTEQNQPAHDLHISVPCCNWVCWCLNCDLCEAVSTMYPETPFSGQVFTGIDAMVSSQSRTQGEPRVPLGPKKPHSGNPS